jgi:Polyketide cyclase / dehydrase and lipid transport
MRGARKTDERLIFSATVEIKAEPAEVFAVVSDLRRKALLNPNIQVIRVELEGEEPVREGSVFYHRFQRGTRILEYRSRCVRLVFPRLFESRSETDPPFEVRVTVDPTPAGCRLTQEETADVTPELLDAFEPAPTKLPSFRDILTLFALFPSARPLESELRAFQHERVTKKLTGELQSWLDTIRAHLEARTLLTT